MPGADFWATSAQTMPVLALAIVVEARAVVARWRPGEMRVYKTFQGLIWATPLVIYFFAISACFRALEGEKVWNGWPGLVTAGITLGLGTIVLSAALEILVRSNARVFARLIFLPAPLIVWYMIRKSRKYRLRCESFATRIASVEAGLDDQERRIQVLGHPECEECVALLATLGEMRSEVADLRSSNDQNLKRLDDADIRARQLRKITPSILREFEAAIEGASSLLEVDIDRIVDSNVDTLAHKDQSPQVPTQGSGHEAKSTSA